MASANPANNPKNVGIIMDGNGRWAKQNSLITNRGHEKGVAVVKEVVKDCLLYTSPSPRDATLSRMPSSA